MGWVPLVAAWPLTKTRVRLVRTNRVKESKVRAWVWGAGRLGLPAQGTREALGLTDWWCEGVGSRGQG